MTEKSEQTTIYEALYKVQQTIKQPKKSETANVTTKNGGSYSYSYATLEAVTKSILDACKGTGLFYMQSPVKNERGEVGVHTVLYHSSGTEIDCGSFLMARDGSSRMSMAQAEGSVLTFCRRYTLSAIFGLSSDAEDGNVDGDTLVVEHEANLLIQDYIIEVASIAQVERNIIQADVLKKVDSKGFNDLTQAQRQQMIGILKTMKIKAKAKRDKEKLSEINSDIEADS